MYQRYDQNGYLWQEGDSRNQSQALKSVTAMNPANQVTAETFGNGSTQIYQHHQRTFQMESTKVNGGNLLTQGYQYDLFGNLKQLDHQQGNNALRTETFSYDHLHRLTQSQRVDEHGQNAVSITYSYDAIGNLTSKSDFANSYSYPSARPNALNSVALVGSGTANYGYDANGNMTTAQGNGNSQAAQDVGQLALKYDPYNKPFFIERNGKRSEFWYGPDDQRYFQLENGNQRTVYIDKLYEQIGSTIHKLYLGDYAVFTFDVTSAANSGINYLHKDRLGSIVSITDESGNLIANAGRSFDPFGKPREEDLADSDGITHASMPDDIGDLNRSDITTRGFTGHEQLNNLSLTHMNGRVYDYNLGRFLGVDPIIAFPENSQSLNPYSYILNNPLSGTDPSGYTPTCQDDAAYCGVRGAGSTTLRCDRGAACDVIALGDGNNKNGKNGSSSVNTTGYRPDELGGEHEKKYKKSKSDKINAGNSRYDKKKVSKALERALTKLRETLSALRKGDKESLRSLDLWYGSVDKKLVAELTTRLENSLKIVEGWIENPDTINYEPNADFTGRADLIDGVKVLALGPAFFSRTKNIRVGTVIHEASHYDVDGLAGTLHEDWDNIYQYQNISQLKYAGILAYYARRSGSNSEHRKSARIDAYIFEFFVLGKDPVSARLMR